MRAATTVCLTMQPLGVYIGMKNARSGLDLKMSPNNEIDRIARVYRGYAADSDRANRLSATNPGNRMIVKERWRVITAILKAERWLPLMDRQILDVGCGFGDELAKLVSLGANPTMCCGVDLIPERIEEARRRHPRIDFRIANAEKLHFADNHFDLVVLSTVFSSILDPAMRQAIAREVARVLKPGGAVIWYDIRYPSPANRNVRPVSRGQLHHLFPEFSQSLETVTLLPPVARRLRGAAPLYLFLAALPLLRSHFIGLITKPVSP